MLRIVAILFPVFALVLVGYSYGRRHRPDMEVANRLNMQIFVPALVFDALSSREFDIVSYRWLALGGLLVVLGSGLLAWPVASWLRYRPRAFVPPMMFNNSGNMGLPLAVLALGEGGLAAAVVLFLVSNTLHFTLGIYLVGGAVSWGSLLTMPVNIALLAGLSTNLLGWRLPGFAQLPITMLGQIAIPLMLFALGVRMVNIDLRAWRVGLAGAVVCPLSGLAVALTFGAALPLDSLQFSAMVLFSALPPAVLNYLFAEEYRQQPATVASIVLIGNLVTVVTLPLALMFVLD
ncbi:MAG: AEC family transporter [Pseudomonadota bacterium]|nr:AEC family transporter [Pseudomonadota bacterium]